MELFPEEKREKGYKGGSIANLSDIDKYVRPLLLDAGFDCKLDKLDKTSNKQRIFPKGEPDSKDNLLAQIIVITDFHSIDTRANSNIKEEIVDSTSEENRIEAQLQVLLKEKCFMFLYIIQGGWFALFPYTDVPKEQWRLAYREKPTSKNRMWVPSDYIPVKFKKPSFLKETLKTYLNLK